MKTKKYLSIIVMVFLVMNLVIASENISTGQEQNPETENSAVNQMGEDVSEVTEAAGNVESNGAAGTEQQATAIEESNNSYQDKEVTEEVNSNSEEVSNSTTNVVDTSTNITFSVNKTLKPDLQNGSRQWDVTCTDSANASKTGETSLSTVTIGVDPSQVNCPDEAATEIKTNQDYSYIDISELNSGSSGNTNRRETNISESINNQTDNSQGIQDSGQEGVSDENRIIRIALFKDGKKELEGEIPASFEDEINKEERILNSENELFSKEVVVKSDEHLESPLVVYSDIPANTKKEDIKLYWKNEDREIEIREYIDENSDGFIDRISWIVPHLSEQIFEIRIGIHESGTSSEEIILTANGPPATVTSNPVNFNFDINYTNINNVNCNLTIYNSTETNTIPFGNSSESSFQLNLPNGDYSWGALCSEKNNASNNDIESGSFTVSIGLITATGLDTVYLSGTTITPSIPSGYTINGVTLTKQNSGTSPVSFSGNSITIPSTSTTQVGTYTLEINSTRNSDELIQITAEQFSIATAEISYSKSNIETGEEVKISTSITTDKNVGSNIIIDFGDSESDYTSQKNKDFYHTYSEEGTFTTSLIFDIEGKLFTITKNGIHVTDSGSEDSSDPTVTLLEPSNNINLRDQTITFRYKATDNVKLDECTYELYLYQDNSDYASLEYEETKKNPSNNQEIKITLRDFDVGNYTWYVGCYDNSSNYDEESRKFRITSSTSSSSSSGTISYTEEQKISNARTDLDNFLTDLNSNGLDEKNVLEEIGIYSDLTTSQKRLLQIQKYFETDYRNTPVEKRDEISQDYLDELDDIIDNTPVSIDITEKDEYIKNSISEGLKEDISRIITARTPSIGKKTLNKLTDSNFDIQGRLTTSVSSMQIEIEYPDRTDEITLVVKTVKTSEAGDSLFEILPEGFGDAVFVTTANHLEDDIYEIDQDDLDNGQIIYYAEDTIDLDKIKNSETIIFEDSPSSSISGITGYTIVDFDVANPINYIILIIFIMALAYSGFTVYQKKAWKKAQKDITIADIISNINRSKNALMQNNIGAAKTSYRKIEETYPFIEKKYQKKLQKEIKKIKAGIAKREIIHLMKEYNDAKKSGKIRETKEAYRKIQQTYKDLPEKYKEKVYKKIFANPLDDIF